jgi:PAS domain S-box-containing protein
MSGLIPRSESPAPATRPILPVSLPVPDDMAVTMELPAYDALALFEATCAQAAIGIAHLREDETWQWVNQRYCDIVGYPREELMSMRLEDITHPDDVELTMDYARRARVGSMPSYTIEKRYIRKDGTTVWGSLTVSRIRTSPNAPVYVVGFLQDITSRRRAEQRLAAQHVAARLLSDAAGGRLPAGLMEAVCRALEWDAAVLWTVDWSEDVLRRVDEWVAPRARTAEHAARLFTLRIGEELPGQVWNSGDAVWIPDLAREATSTHTHHAADAGLHGAIVLPIRNGAICGVIELYSAEIQPPEPELLRTLTVIGNGIARVLEQARTEEIVREAEARKTAIIETTLDSVVSIDAEGRVLEFNPAAERTFGYRREDVIGKKMADKIVPPAFRARHIAGMTRYLATGASRILGHRGEFSAMRADGTEFPIELTVTRVPGPGAPVFTAFIRDITERKRAEQELQHSVSLLRATLEATAEGVLVVSNEGRITSYNKRMAQMWGIPDSIFALGRDTLALTYAARKVKQPEAFLAKVRDLNDDRDAESYDVVELTDGRILERTSRPQRVGGKSIGRVWSFRDVTERRRAEEAVRESEERFRSLTEAALEGVLIHENGIIVDANPSLCRMLGYTLEELVGGSVLDMLVAPESHDVVRSHIQSGASDTYYVTGRRRDGTRIDVEVSGRLSTYRGRKARVVAIHDITERKAAEEAALRLLEEQAARSAAEAAERRAHFLAEASRVLGTSFDYHTTLASLAKLVVPALADFCTVDVLEADGRIARVGVAHVDSSKEAMLFELGRRFVDRIHDGPAAAHLRRAITAGESTLVSDISQEALSATAVSEDHRRIIFDLLPCSLIAVPLRVGDRTIGVLSLMNGESGRHFGPDDLTHAEELARRASLAVENARLFHAAEQATRARDEMLGVVAHDLRNPLSTITMAAQLMLDIAPAERATERKQLEIMRRAGERMKRLIGDLLDAKRIESGGLTVDPRPEEVATVVNDAVEMLRPLASSSSLQLEAAVPDGLPRVMADPARVQQVLSNLVGNAIKFTPAGGSITVRAEMPADGEVCLAVTDTGTGIPNEELPHIFGRFWQGKRTDRRGVGLGLAIAKAIVEAHQGRIWVESQVGVGTSFYFTVPVVR